MHQSVSRDGEDDKQFVTAFSDVFFAPGLGAKYAAIFGLTDFDSAAVWVGKLASVLVKKVALPLKRKKNNKNT